MGDTREDVFNEVIYGLGVLLKMEQAINSGGRSHGILMSLEYVKAMKELEA